MPPMVSIIVTKYKPMVLTLFDQFIISIFRSAKDLLICIIALVP